MRISRVLVCSAIFAVSFHPLGIAQPTPQVAHTQAEKEVLEASETIDRGIREVRPEIMAPVLSDDLEYTNQFGEVLSKTQWLDNVRSGKMNTVTLLHEVAGLHVYGDSAVLIGISHTTFIYEGKTSSTPRRFTRFFVKQDGRWKMVAQHVCTIAEQ
jgi:ketosteroid isomerase-like protein